MTDHHTPPHQAAGKRFNVGDLCMFLKSGRVVRITQIIEPYGYIAEGDDKELYVTADGLQLIRPADAGQNPTWVLLTLDTMARNMSAILLNDGVPERVCEDFRQDVEKLIRNARRVRRIRDLT